MAFNMRYLIEKINNNTSINDTEKEDVVKYVLNNLKNYIYIYDDTDLDTIYAFMKDINFNIEYLDRIFKISYSARNAVNVKNGQKNSLPRAFYVVGADKFLNDLNIDPYTYPVNDNVLNLTFGRAIYEIICDRNTLNNEISIADFVNAIHDEFYSYRDKAYSSYKIIKVANLINRAVIDLNINGEKIFCSEDIKSLFEMKYNIESLYLYDIMIEFYPKLGTKIFTLMKKCEDEKGVANINQNIITKYLNDAYMSIEKMSIEKGKINKNLKKIEFETDKKIIDIFSELLDKVEANQNISDSVKNKIIEELNRIQEKYKGKQWEYIDSKLNDLLNNYLYYVNELIIPNHDKKKELEELIVNAISDCKDFFVTVDGKKFKEMTDFFTKETDISYLDMNSKIKDCIEIIKKSDVTKLKVINESLKEFENFVNDNNKDSLLKDDLFKNIFMNNPSLLSKDNDINRVVNFLMGNIDLKDYGYKCNFKLNSDVLSYDYLKNIALNNPSLLFNTSIEKIIGNLQNLENICGSYAINFRKLKFNEDVIDLLINEKVLNESNNNLRKLEDLISKDYIKKLMEMNPYLLCIDDDSMNAIVSRCIMNSNEKYDFYSLLFSELYYFNEDFKNMKYGAKLECKFQYIDLDFKVNEEFDPELVLASNLVNGKNAEIILSSYVKREKDMKSLDELVSSLGDNEDIENLLLDLDIINKLYFKLYNKVGNVNIIIKIRDILNDKLSEYQTKKEEANLNIKENNRKMKSESNRSEDISYSIDNIRNIIDNVHDEELKTDLKAFIKNTLNIRLEDSTNKQNELDDMINKTLKLIAELDKKIENINNAFVYNSDCFEDIDDEEYNEKKYFTIDDSETSVEENEHLLSLDDNVVVFASGVDLKDVPNDANFIDKFYKFLIDPKSSLLSKEFMDANSTRDIYIEKYNYPRKSIWSRRENRTSVRVYFIPVHTKYFTCYYVIGTNYKDDSHLDGGCSTDGVYNQRVKEAKELKKFINSLSEEDALEFVKENKTNYDYIVKPIVEKYNSTRKSKK